MIKLQNQRVMDLLLAAVVLFFGANVLAQTSTSQTKKKDSDADTAPRFEVGIFGGGQFWKLRQAANPVPTKLVNGGVYGARLTWDFHPYIGIETAWSMRGVNNIQFQPVDAPPGHTVAFGARNSQLWAGPVFYLTPRTSKFRPFLTVGPAWQYFFPTRDARGQTAAPAFVGLGVNGLDDRYGPALTWGGGVKWAFNSRFLMRIDYHGTWSQQPHFGLSSAPAPPGGVFIPSGGTEIGSQVTLGLGFRFHRPVAPPAPAPPPPPPPPPPAALKDMNVSLAKSAGEVCPGEVVTVTASGNIPSDAQYQWSVNGEAVNQAKSFDFGTSGRSAGSYNIATRITGSGYNPGTASTSVVVRAYRPPSGNVEVQPGEIYAGEKATLSAQFTGQCGGTIGQPKYSASEGTVVGNTFDSSGVQFAPGAATEQQKTITITASAADDKQTGTATTSLVVKKKPALTKRLPDILFARNSARVNNCGKRVLLEQLKTYLDQDPTGKVIFVGHMAPNEPKASHLDRKRAENAAAVISAGKAICLGFPASQILIGEAGTSQEGAEFQPFFCGSSTESTRERAGQSVSSKDKNAQLRRVEVWFVPTGGVMPPAAANYKDATAYGVSKLGCPK